MKLENQKLLSWLEGRARDVNFMNDRFIVFNLEDAKLQNVFGEFVTHARYSDNRVLQPR